jgi:cytochrome c-type biogenesis protein CcmH/NrfF
MKLKYVLILSLLLLSLSCDEEDASDDRIFVTVEIDLRNQVNGTCHDNDITYIVNDVAHDIQEDFNVGKGNDTQTEVTTRYGDFINLQAYFTNDNTNRLLAEANIDT